MTRRDDLSNYLIRLSPTRIASDCLGGAQCFADRSSPLWVQVTWSQGGGSCRSPWTHLEEQLASVALSDGERTLPPPAGAAEQVSAVWDHNPRAAPETYDSEHLVTPKIILNMCRQQRDEIVTQPSSFWGSTVHHFPKSVPLFPSETMVRSLNPLTWLQLVMLVFEK